MARLLRRGGRGSRPAPCPLPADEAPRAGPHAAGRLPRDRLESLREHHPGGRGALVPGGRAARAPHPRLHPLERRRHGDPGQRPDGRDRRPPVHLRELGRALRGRVQPLLPGQVRRGLRRPGLLPGSRLPRRLRTGLSSKAGSPRNSSTTSATRSGATASPATPTLVLLPGFWEFPTVSMGLGPINAIYQAHINRYLEQRQLVDTSAGRGLVLRRRRRDGRARVHRRPGRRRARASRQPDLRRELQPATPRRTRPGQRQDHPGARGGVPRRGLERHQGDLGFALGRAAGPRRRRRPARQDEHHGRRRVPEVRHRDAAPTSASTSSGPTPGCARWSST